MRCRTTYDDNGNYSSAPAAPRDLIQIARGVMELHWQPHFGFSVPNATVYPWMWLWDSCFHAIIWAGLGDDRAVTELQSVFDYQSGTGFVPHMGYQSDPSAAVDLWGVEGHSTITQPPMLGHALRVLSDFGFDVQGLAGKVQAALWYFFEHRMTDIGLVAIWHPWESGADDSPRWEQWQPAPFVREVWGFTKHDLVAELDVEQAEAVGSRGFSVCPASFNALVAWNAIEAGMTIGDAELVEQGKMLSHRIDELLWNEESMTWVDVDPSGKMTSAVRTMDSLLPFLVTDNVNHQASVIGQLLDYDGFGQSFGPSGVHPAEPAYDPDGYWRGAAWPQLAYLMWQGAIRNGTEEAERVLGSMLQRGADRSGFAEYWNPKTGNGLGARPQSWTCLAALPMIYLQRHIGTWRPQSDMLPAAAVTQSDGTEFWWEHGRQVSSGHERAA